MLPKPASCLGCPFYGDGKGFVPDIINNTAPVCVMGQGPGQDEEEGRRLIAYEGRERVYEPHPPAPFLGPTGYRMNFFLQIAGLSREEVSLANPIRCRRNHTDWLPKVSAVELQTAVAHCQNAHWRPPEGVRLFIATGEYAHYALTGLTKDFAGWRGYLLPYQPPGEPRNFLGGIWHPEPRSPSVLTTFHIAYLFHNADAELPARADWKKVSLIRAGVWPKRYPGHSTTPPDVWPDYAAFDTEYSRTDPSLLIRWSLATRDRQVWVVEGSAARPTIAPGSTLIMQNSPVDIPHAAKLLATDIARLTDPTYLTIHDTMYAHSVRWTGKEDAPVAHNLNYLGSIYSWLNRWKHLERLAAITYSGADALGTLDVWCEGIGGGIYGELLRDPASMRVYEEITRPLIPIIMEYKLRGTAVDQEEARKVRDRIRDGQKLLEQEAIAYTGMPGFALSSPQQIKRWLFQVERVRE